MKVRLTARETLFQWLKSLNAWLLQLETTPDNQNTCSGAGEDVGLPGLETCTSVQLESRDGTPGLQYMSASGEESWTTVTGKNLGDKDFATALKDSRGVMYRQREGAPGLEL